MAQRHRKNGDFTKDPLLAEKDAKACALFAEGYTYREIADELGWKAPSTALRAIERAYKATVAVPADHARRRSLERLDHAHRRVRGILDADHVMVSHGKVVYFEGEEGTAPTPVPDYGPNLQAAARIEAIEARISRLLGLDAPQKTSVEVFTRDAWAAEMERMAAELEEREKAEAAEVAAGVGDDAGFDAED